MQNIKTKLCALMLKKGIKDFKASFDYTEHGGAPVLGAKKVVIKAHGSSNAKAFYSAIRQAKHFHENGVIEAINDNLQKPLDEQRYNSILYYSKSTYIWRLDKKNNALGKEDYIMELEQIRKILAEQFSMNEDDITMDTSFTEDIGADSLDLVELVMALEQEFDIEIDDDEVENIKTVGDAVRYIKDKA